MNQQDSQSSKSENYSIPRRIKRWATVCSALILTGFLLVALYSLLNPRTFSNPVVAQTEDLIDPNGWINEGNVIWAGTQVTITGGRTYQVVVPTESTVHRLTLSAANISGGASIHINMSEFLVKSTWLANGMISITVDYNLQAGHSYTVSISPEWGGITANNISLVPLDLPAPSGDFLLNGTFDAGVFPWVENSTYVARWNAQEGVPSPSMHLFFEDHGPWPDNGNVHQAQVADETNVYDFSISYLNSSASSHGHLGVDVHSNNPLETEFWDGYFSGEWITDTHRYLLRAGMQYTTTIAHVNGQRDLYVDNIHMIPSTEPFVDLDTGIVQNGDFIGPEGWNYYNDIYSDNDTRYIMMDYGFTTVGAARIWHGEVTQTVTAPYSDTYILRFRAYGESSGTGQRVNVNLTGFQTQGYSIPQGSWITVTLAYPLQGNESYELGFWPQHHHIFIDDVSFHPLTYPPEIQDDMVLGSKEGNSCSGLGEGMLNSTQGWIGDPINPRNGNVSVQATELSIPVAGCQLEFFRSYASEATDMYTATMGHGWTHNYDMRLHLTNTIYTNSVDVQVGSGSRLPFIEQPDGSFEPYAGVTGQMVQLGNTYVVTGANQKVYTFDDTGRILSQTDPNDNEITFTYYITGPLQEVRQEDRYLTYFYEQYNGVERLVKVKDHTNREVWLTYNDDNELIEVMNPLGQTTSYTYTVAGTHEHLLYRITDASDRMVEETAYDNDGRAYQQWDGAGNLLVDIDYSQPNSHIVSVDGVVSNYSYDGRKTLVDSTYTCTDGTPGCGTSTGIHYDGNFRQDNVADGNENPAVLDWDASGTNLEYVQNALEEETFLTYDQYNNLTQTVDARANATQYEYSNPNFPTFMTKMTDALGKSTLYTPTTTLDGVPGLLKAAQDPNGRITTYEYNEYGQVIEQVVAAGTPDAMTITYEYDTLGRLIIITQTSASESHQSLNVYNAGDQLIATIENWMGNDPAEWESDCVVPAKPADENICTRYDYDQAGRPVSTTNALGQTNLTLYDAAGRVVTSVVNYDGTTTFATLCTDFTDPNPEYNICSLTGYDQYGRVYTTTNSLGHQTVTEYDSLGRVSRTIVNWVDGVFNAADRDRDLITQYDYDAVGNVLVVTDPLGHKTRTFYDALNRVTGTLENWDGSTILANCANLPRERDSNICTQYQYDEVGNTVFVTNTLTQTTRTFYNPLNQVIASVQNWQPGFDDPDQCVLSSGNTSSENVCTRYGYNDAGQQITTTNALNQTSLTVYDAAARPFLMVANWDGTTPIDEASDCQFPPAYTDVNVCTLTTYDSLGRRASTKDQMGHITEFAYDELGRLETTTRYLDGLPVTDHTEYDALGNRLSSTDAEGHTTTYEYDSLNRLVQTTTPEGVVTSQAYNAAGWVITSTNGLGHSTIVGYDLMGRRTSVIDPEGNTTTTQFDALGTQTAVIDAEGVKASYDYDGLNRLTAVTENDILGTNPSNETDVLTQYQYDALGNRVVITNALGFTSSYTLYDDLNRPILVRDGLGNGNHTAYNALGMQTVITDANAAVTTYSYDGSNRLTTIGYQADGELVSYELDAAGNRLAMLHNLGTTAYEYDDLYRLITVTNPFTAVVGYRYDKVGNRTGLVYPDGKVVTYTYDRDNRLIQVEDWDEGMTAYQYDAAGRLTTAELPNGVVTFYTYDDANRLIELQHIDSTTGETIARYEYELDNVGNRTAVTETLQLPTTPGGQASLPFGVSSADDAPLTAADAVAAIQPPDITLDKDRLSRPPLQGPPPPLTPPTQPPDTGVYTTTTPLPLVEGENLPFDPTAVVEEARNQLQTEPDGDAFIERPAHEARIDTDGTLIFAPVITATDLLTATLDPSTPLTVSLELARLTMGTDNLSIVPTPGEQEVSENVASLPRGSQLVEEFVARDGGIEQRWQLLSPPSENGNLTLVVEATTALAVTVDGDGFVFHAPTEDEPMIPVARYGRALAIDASGAQQWAELSFTELQPAPDGRHRYQLQMTIPADWLATAQYPLLIDPLLSNLVRLEQSAPVNDQSAPEVAYNPDLDEFLLVWQDFRNGNWDIYAQRVNGDGALLDENFIITNAANQQSNPRIEYGGDVYLVAWKHHPGSSSTVFDTYGAVISGTGAILTNNIQIAAGTGSNDQEAPSDIVYNSTSNQFLVLYRTLANGWANVWGRRVNPDGTMSSAIQITSQANNHEESAAGAYNPQTNSYLVAWESTNASTRKVYGQRLTSSGSPTGSVRDMSTGSGDERQIDMLYLDTVDRFVLVWRDNRNNGSSSYDIYGQQVNPDGTLEGSNFVISAETVEESFPRLALSPAAGGALVVWQTNNGGSAGYDLYGRMLDNNGLVAGEPFAVETVNANQQRPVLVANSEGDMLVAWYDVRNGNQDIYTSMKLADGGWGGAGMAHPAPGAQEKPQIAYNPDDDEYLVVWQDYRSSTDWDIYGQRVDGDGSLLGQNIAIDTTATKHQTAPQVSYGANEYLVAWQHYTDNNNTTYDVYGRVVNRDGSFATSAFVIANALNSSLQAMKETPHDIAYNSSSNQFLVVGKAEYSANNWNIWGRHVSPSGTTGTYIQIATASDVEQDAAVAYNAEDNQYLVAWESINSFGFSTVMGRRVSGSGTVTTSDNIQVSTNHAALATADVLYRSDTDRYLVVWQQGGNVYSRGVLPNGTTAGNATAVADTSQTETFPRLAADSQGLLAIWQRQNSGSGYDLYARPLDANGMPSGEPFTIQETTGNQQNSAIAYGINNRYQLAWQDDATGPWDLFTATLDRSYQVTHIQYDYDPLYRLTEAIYSGDISASYDYTYDAVGNMTAYTETVGTETSSVNRTFNAVNQLVSSTSGGPATDYSYDNNGNMIEIDQSAMSFQVIYSYNQRNLLTGQTNWTIGEPALVAEFVYDGDGNRLQQIDHSGSQPITTTYTNDIVGLSQVLVSNDGTTITYNLFGLDLISQDNGNETRTLLADGLGSTRLEMVVNVAGVAIIQTATTYEPYGKLLARTGLGGTIYGFTGEQYDALTNLVYLRARYYNPYLNQFQSRDPFPGYARFPASQNGYSYAHNNPVNNTDPSGKMVDVGERISGGCSYSNSTSCERFIAEVQTIIDQLKEERECNPLLKIVDESALALDILAAYYSGIPFNVGSLYTGFIPRNSTFAPGTPDKWEVPPIPWAPDAGFEWDHPINQHANRAGAYTQNNLNVGESLRQGYGFKRPFYDQTHHYFAFLKFAFRGGIMFPLGTDRLVSDNILWQYHKNQEIKTQIIGLGAFDEWQSDPDNPVLRQRYAWIYEESVRDLYIMSLALEDARAIRNSGIDVLPTRLRRWCATNEADVWSSEGEVNQYYFDFPQENWPAEDFWPNQ